MLYASRKLECLLYGNFYGNVEVFLPPPPNILLLPTYFLCINWSLKSLAENTVSEARARVNHYDPRAALTLRAV